MIRRLALILALLSPLAGSAQTAGNVTILPAAFGTDFAQGAQRIISWQSKVPVFRIIGERIPQTLTVVGTVVGTVVAVVMTVNSPPTPV